MTLEMWQSVEDLFERGRRMPPETLPEFLDDACGENDEIRRQVEQLLAASSRKRGGLDEPLFEIMGEEHIGRYKILGRLASDSTSTIFLVVSRTDPHQARLVLKVLQAGGGVVSLFGRKKSDFQSLQHPGLVSFLDAGTTTLDEPYLVSEYVDGRPIDAYCNENSLTVGQRLELFFKVCNAVAFAHQSLIAHRALRPGKILITTDGEPKILDFGLVRLLEIERRSRDSDDPTRPAERLAPSIYASPETTYQDRPQMITSDVYSLGAILFELLTGRHPYQFKSRSLAEMYRVIREEQPDVPSRYAEGLPAGTDRVVSKALAKSPEERYRSARELADEIRQLRDSRLLVV